MEVLNIGQVYTLIQSAMAREKGLGPGIFCGWERSIQKGLWLWWAGRV